MTRVWYKKVDAVSDPLIFGFCSLGLGLVFPKRQTNVRVVFYDFT